MNLNHLRLSIVVLCSAAAWCQQYTISTVAGNGTQGFSGDGGPAPAGQLAQPGAVAVDASGNIYIADGINHRIRMVSNGNITTIAGNGTAGFAGDGASASSAQLNDPTGVAIDSSGNIYIADSGNNVIRKISGSTISSFAGNYKSGAGYSGDGAAATSAQLATPVGVAVDSSGNVYIADALNNVIRKVASGNISTVVGGTATTLQLNHPDAVAVDAAGNLYIADTGNRRIVQLAGGVASVIAGTGATGFSGDNGPATKAALNDPTGVGVDSAGIVYVADTFNNRIRRIGQDGTILTIAGKGSASYSGDGGPAGSAGLNFPHGVAIDKSGNIYVADTGNNAIRLLQPQLPTVVDKGIVNAASFLPQISPGALATVFGTNFAGGNTGTGFPLPTRLGGVTVKVNGQAAPLLFVNGTQANFQVPWATDTTAGSATIVVNSNGVDSNAVKVSLLTAGPGLFVLPNGQAIVQNSDFSLNTPDNPAKTGGTVVAYLTGSGPVNPTPDDGAPAPTSPLAKVTSSFSATIGSAAATVSFAGLTPGFVGLLQMNIVVPASLSAGNYPLIVTINGESSNSGMISVSK